MLSREIHAKIANLPKKSIYIEGAYEISFSILANLLFPVIVLIFIVAPCDKCRFRHRLKYSLVSYVLRNNFPLMRTLRI